jgi:aspartate 1-decarboxylase
MNVTLLKCKIHRARVTGAVLDYEGSISICPDLIKAAGLLPWEKVDIYNINTGHRFSTYVIEGNRGDICLNGAAARLVQAGDLVIICAYASMDAKVAPEFRPTVVLVDEANRPQPVESPKTSGGAKLRTV